MQYPVGEQSFETLRNEGYVYVDKTEIIYDLTHNGKYFFLSRPRRFGKSLLVSTLQAYFEGRKDLFEGLKIAELEQDWVKYPVLKLDFNHGEYSEKDGLGSILNVNLCEWEKIYGADSSENKSSERFAGVIKRAYEKTGKQVVVLIDEYDKPLISTFENQEINDYNKKLLASFYSVIKSQNDKLRFVFLTGITKFSQLNIFSALNSLKNISMLPKYAAICGITEQEMLDNFQEGIGELAAYNEWTKEETIQNLKAQYDGYHFTWPSPDIYNPFSLLLAFDTSLIKNYWFETATPTFLIETLRKNHVKPENIGGLNLRETLFDIPLQSFSATTPLLYHSGYLTIKGYNRALKTYLIDIPNNEVRIGLMENLLLYYVDSDKVGETINKATQIGLYLAENKLEEALKLIQTFLRTIPYTNDTDYEGHYQSLLVVIFSLSSNVKVGVEVHTVDGRIDVLMETPKAIYIMEVKFGHSAQEAMAQINIKDYQSRFALDKFPIIKVGLNFNRETRTISDWVIEEV